MGHTPEFGDTLLRVAGHLNRGADVYLDHQLRRTWWEQLKSMVEPGARKPFLVTQRVPASWPVMDGVRLIQTQDLILRSNQQIQSAQRPEVTYHRRTRDLDKTFVMTCGTADQGRSMILRHSDILGLTEQALTSSPAIAADQLAQDPDPWCMNEQLRQASPGRWLEGRDIDRESTRLAHDRNAALMISQHQRCHFAVAMDNNPDWMDGNGFMTEKMLWAFWSGVPVIWLANTERRSQLEQWGFRDSSDDSRALRDPDPDSAVAIRDWCREIGHLERLVRSSASQRWQDAQGPRVAENYRLVQTLTERLLEDQWQQWRRITG